MSLQQVAVTGLGVMAPHGADASAMFDALMRAESAVEPVFPDLPKPAAAATVNFDASPWFTKLQLAGVDRVSQLAVAAADLAMRDAGSPTGIDPERIGLGDYGRPGNYFERQVARWTKQYRGAETETLPEMERLIEWLPRTVPPQTRTSIVHGDYRVDNLCFAPDDETRVAAVLDWEPDIVQVEQDGTDDVCAHRADPVGEYQPAPVGLDRGTAVADLQDLP